VLFFQCMFFRTLLYKKVLVFPCAEIAVVVLPSSDKYSSFVVVMLPARCTD
jgi:hypothetical protein